MNMKKYLTKNLLEGLISLLTLSRFKVYHKSNYIKFE